LRIADDDARRWNLTIAAKQGSFRVLAVRASRLSQINNG